MDKFILLHIICKHCVMQLLYINSMPMRKDETEFNYRSNKKALTIQIVEDTLEELKKHELINVEDAANKIKELQKIKEFILNGDNDL